MLDSSIVHDVAVHAALPRPSGLAHSPFGDPGALATRVVILEAALACIQRECEAALEQPQVSFGTVLRIDSLARQTLGPCDVADAE